MPISQASAVQALLAVQGLHPEAGPSLYLDQQLRRSQQLYLVQFATVGYRGITSLRCGFGLYALRCAPTGAFGACGAHARQLHGEAMEHAVDVVTVGEHVGLGDWCRLADRRGHDVEHDELPAQPGIPAVPHLPDVGGDDDQRECQMG